MRHAYLIVAHTNFLDLNIDVVEKIMGELRLR